MAELMLINPRKRKSKKGKMPPGLKRYWATMKRKKTAKKGKHGRPIYQHMRNPAVAKKSRKRHRSITKSLSVRRPRKYRRNPTRGIGKFSVQSFTKNTLMPSAVGAAGALGLDVLIGFLPLPPALKTGPFRSVVRVVGAIGLGMVAAMVVKKSTAEQIAAGAITVTLYDTLKGVVRQAMPTLQLGETDIFEEYPSLAYAGAGQTVDGMGVYDSPDEMGMYVGDTSNIDEQY